VPLESLGKVLEWASNICLTHLVTNKGPLFPIIGIAWLFVGKTILFGDHPLQHKTASQPNWSFHLVFLITSFEMVWAERCKWQLLLRVGMCML